MVIEDIKPPTSSKSTPVSITPSSTPSVVDTPVPVTTGQTSALPDAPSPPAPAVRSAPQKKKVLYLVMGTFFDGTQKYVCDLAGNAKEFNVAVMLPPARDNAWEGMLARKLAERNVGMIFTRPLGKIQGYKKYLKFYYVYSALRADRPDVLHITSPQYAYGTLLLARFALVPKIIFTVHGWSFQEPANIFLRALRFLGTLFIIFLSSKVICVSGHDRGIFAGWFFQNKLVSIRKAIPEEEYYEREDARRDLVAHSNLYANDLWVGSIAELSRNKNISLAICAVAKAREAGCPIFYCIVGDGIQRLELEDLINELKLDQNVKILGFVSDAQKYIKAFDIALLTSRKEGMPYFLLEAQRAGVPIIASNVGGIPEIIRDAENGLLFKSNDVEQLSSDLIRLCKDQELRVDFARAKPIDHFEDMLRETYALYR